MHNIEAIGKIHSPFKEKFAVPRQPRLSPSAQSRIQLLGESNSPEAVRGIEQFSHLWLLFLFDQNIEAGWKPTVRPPRLGGNERIGVFASRATFRPNAIGMSAVELKGVTRKGSQVWLELGSADLVDGTPVIDIKPYIPYSDSIPNAQGGFADEEPETLEVNFSEQSINKLNSHPNARVIIQVIKEVLAQDPRPAYKKGKPDHKEYAVNLFDLNVKFVVEPLFINVTDIERF